MKKAKSFRRTILNDESVDAQIPKVQILVAFEAYCFATVGLRA